MKIYLHILLIASTIILTSAAVADTVKVETKVRSTISGDEVNIDIRMKNIGDEAVHDLVVTVETDGIEKTCAIKSRLGVNKTSGAVVSFAPAPKTGRFPIIVRASYTGSDENRYHIVAVSAYGRGEKPSPVRAGFIIPGREASSGIRLTGGREETVWLFLKDDTQGALQRSSRPGRDKDVRPVKLRLIYPGDIEIKPDLFNVSIGTGDEKRVLLSVKNRSLNPGSVCTVYALAEYDENETHYLDIAPTSVVVGPGEKEKTLFPGWSMVFVAAGLLMLLAFALANKRTR